MKLLIDTFVLLLAATDDPRLSPESKALISDERNELFFSPASIWWLVLLKDRAPINPTRLRQLLLENGYKELPITATHTLGVQLLPPIDNHDLFYRIIISQSCAESALLVTQDPRCLRYPGVLSPKELIQLQG
jgi:PIN domain nuclease of toxin-antitoxin system